MLGKIDFEHPLFAPFADPRYSDFTKIHFWKYRRVAADQLPGARVLASFDTEDPALIELPVGRGFLLVLTSGWQPSDSQLALSSKFVPLLYSMLERGAGLHPSRVHYHVGDQVLLSAVTPTGNLTIRKPDGIAVETTNGASFADTDLPGVYAVGSQQATQLFAVNIPP